MKKTAKWIIVTILVWQVRRLRRKNKFKVIAIAGSSGKTSTKFAIASVLKQRYKLLFQEGNYNDPVTVPLIFFDQAEPSLFNPLAWLKVLISNERRLRRPYPYEVVVVELGVDGPGQMKQFEYLQVDMGVLTAIGPEHMEFFKTVEAVAQEELVIAQFSQQLLVNADLCERTYLTAVPHESYGTGPDVTYQLTDIIRDQAGYRFAVRQADKQVVQASYPAVSKMQLYSLTAASAVADMMSLTSDEIVKGLAAIQPVSGRMQILPGLNGSTIWDDSYNASPPAMKAALEALYQAKAASKIALLGNMNELGDYSPAAHTEIGQLCDPEQLSLVVTLGSDANRYLAPAAEAAGCAVKQCDSPNQAAAYIKDYLKPGSLLLAKGSQNGVFAEEAVKLLLANPADAAKLVRQSPDWLAKKQRLLPEHLV